MYNALSWSGDLVRGWDCDGGIRAEEANMEGFERGLLLEKPVAGRESLLWPLPRWEKLSSNTEEELARREAVSALPRVWELLVGAGLPSSLLLAAFTGSLTRRLFIPLRASSESPGLYGAAGSRL